MSSYPGIEEEATSAIMETVMHIIYMIVIVYLSYIYQDGTMYQEFKNIDHTLAKPFILKVSASVICVYTCIYHNTSSQN